MLTVVLPMLFDSLYACPFVIDNFARDCLQCLLQCLLEGIRPGTQARAKLVDASIGTSSLFACYTAETL